MPRCPRSEHSTGPKAPVISPPDLPDRFDLGRPAPHADLFAARIELDGSADAAHASIEQSLIAGAGEELDLTGATLIDVDVTDLRFGSVRARSASLRRVRFTGGRIGTLDLSDTRIGELELRHVRIDYLTLAGAQIEDVMIGDCVLTTLDLPQAKVSRAAFASSRVDDVDTRGMRAEHLDLRGLEALAYLDVTALRGATLAPHQVELLAPAFAAAFGIRVSD
ncbi:pentapeptide repeat-containing protein [Microbacterium terrisoli]|jgi:uncharacterized protein YjbI with pentapeptide repeats|uniref:pentapeptide repeat-containing protein n=1 Tax=Microbacterium terrisoli TaxID=3242192 RepID=UPI002803C17A|nr:pentapeptide repeat-containing protein [Microbacterium protaetiae]